MGDENSDVLAQFMAITGADEVAALSFLEATNWQLQQAVELHFASGQSKAADSTADNGPVIPPDTDDGVRAPIPAKVERLVDGFGPSPSGPFMRGRGQRVAHHEAFRNYSAEREEMLHGADAPGATKGLAKLFKPPLEIMFNGGFDRAKQAAADEKKWLMVNVQSAEEFGSHMLNRDTFANDAVKEMIAANFIFMQVYDVAETGQKVINFYKTKNLPAILVIDPVTGALMQGMDGFVESDRLIEELVKFMECNPLDEGVGRLVNQKKKNESRGGGPSTSASAAGINQQGALTEDEQMAMAIAMSIQSTKKPQDSGDEGDEDNMFGDDDSELYPSSTDDDQVRCSPGPSVPDSADNAGPRDESSPDDMEENDVDPEPDHENVNEANVPETPEQVAAGAQARLPPEPDADDPDRCTVAFRLPDGSRIQRLFRKTNAVQSLHDFALTIVPEAAGGREFSLALMMPGAAPFMDMMETVEAAGAANSMLVFRWKD
ncbi:hypothetical protein BSKO_07900 [Bryopsis sp. KO-2023]|nr:hypothetical protein BSKO_07900 [Bryopsis sp. KO-2023]